MDIVIKGVDIELFEKIEKKIKSKTVTINHRGSRIDLEFIVGKEAVKGFLKKCNLL